MFAPSARLLIFGAADDAGAVTIRAADGSPAGSGRIAHARTPSGGVAMTYWEAVSIPGLAGFSSGRIPARQDADAPLFATFGREQVLVKNKSTRPVKKKKSPLLLRLRRWLSGY